MSDMTSSPENTTSIEEEMSPLSSPSFDAKINHIDDQYPEAVDSPPESSAYISTQNISKTRRVIKVGRNIEGRYCEYSIEKLIKWDHAKKRAKGRNYWVDIESPSPEDMTLLEQHFKLHPLTVEEIMNEDSREKIEVFEDRKYMFIASKEVHYKEGTNELETIYINIIIFNHLVLTFHTGKLFSVDYLLNSIRKMETNISKQKMRDSIDGEDNGFTSAGEKFMQSSDWTVYAILNILCEMFEAYVERVTLEGDALDELVLVFNSEDQNDLLRRIGMARRLMSYVRAHLRAKKDILTNLTAKEHHLISKDIKLYLRDVLDDVVRLDEKISTTKDTLNNLHQTYLARLSIEVSVSANKVNGIMKTFSALGVIFIPLNFISALMGMNVRVPGMVNDDSHSLVPFFIVLSIMAAIVICIVATLTIRRSW